MIYNVHSKLCITGINIQCGKPEYISGCMSVLCQDRQKAA